MLYAFIADVEKTSYESYDYFKMHAAKYWRAPELFALDENANSSPSLTRFDYSKSKIFSLGLLSLYCLDRIQVLNYRNMENGNMLNRNQKLLSHYLNSLSTNFPPIFINLLRRILNFSPFMRPEIDDLLDDLEFISLKINDSKIFSR